MLRPWYIHFNIDRTIQKPVHLQIADEIITYIKNGTLKAGETLPGSRKIASLLKVNRNTVIHAFEILLVEGWLSSSERKGSYVSEKLPSFSPSTKEKAIEHHLYEEILQNDLILFDDGLPDTSRAPMNELARSYRRLFTQKAKWQMMNR